MTNEKVACQTCGALILPDTAQKTGGLCMPCAGGYRAQMETAREERVKLASGADPFWSYWLSLVDRVHECEDGFDRLSDPEKLYFGVNLLSREVFNGGFDAYFWNSSASYYPYAVSGLKALGAHATLDLLGAARSAMFGEDEMPLDVEERREYLIERQPEGTPPEISEQLEKLNEVFCKDREEIDSRLELFLLSFGFVKPNA